MAKPDNSLRTEFPVEVAEQLGCYVYLYIDPIDKQIFYVGKGKGNRAFDHLREEDGESEKRKRIEKIQQEGKQPEIQILRHGLSDDQAALVEASVIDLLGIETLTNQVRGMHSRFFGRATITDLLLTGATEATIEHQMLLLRINKFFRSGMSCEELYDVTRGVWKVRKNLDLKYACAVYQGVVREVFQIESWHPAGTTPYITRNIEPSEYVGRLEFKGALAPEDIRKKYLFKSVRMHLGDASQNPIRYVCPS